ncbi:MAG TPA: antitoxin Xre/MbcA/ParS toxin-binding domain-containing protein [Terracidiphilus sp.]|jgi:putative toxin-antitoxin system antitoxin component (TIGR02293 family)
MSQVANVALEPSPAFALSWLDIARGVPLRALEDFSIYSGIPLKDLLEVIIPARTLKHRRQRQEPLNLDESDRLARVARLYELAVKVFDDADKARRWLSKPKERFQEHSPVAMMRTELGGRQVEEMLYQIDEGMFV